jgi:FKBP-type peptidyl-prolyl cis-trans isomerase
MRRIWSVALLSCLACGCVASQQEAKQAAEAEARALAEKAPPVAETTPAGDTPVPSGPVVPKDDKGEFTTTASGLMYRIFEPGNDKKPTIDSTITAKYRGWLDSGKEFDSGTITYPLVQLVKGWQEGLPMIGEGGRMEMIIPSKIGYGDAGFPPDIPPRAWLHFDMELQKVTP